MKFYLTSSRIKIQIIVTGFPETQASKIIYFLVTLFQTWIFQSLQNSFKSMADSLSTILKYY